jgi:hypothetical protein
MTEMLNLDRAAIASTLQAAGTALKFLQAALEGGDTLPTDQARRAAIELHRMADGVAVAADRAEAANALPDNVVDFAVARHARRAAHAQPAQVEL